MNFPHTTPWRLVLAAVCGICTGGAVGAQVAAPAEPAAAGAAAGAEESGDLGGQLDAFMRERVAEDDFSGSVLVSRGGRPILSAGYGLANREHGVPCTARTKYRLGSITKQFTAVAILALQEAGELDVRDSIELYLPDLPEAWHPITIHQLLCHQSGLWNVTSDVDYMRWARLPARPGKTIERAFERPLDFEPGQRFSYSNTGYLTLALVVEETSGESWEAYLGEALFGPLGMRDSGHDRNDTILPHRASGYEKSFGTIYNAPFHDMSVPIGGGDLYSTVEDLSRWEEALFEGELLSAASREAMFTPNKSSYGYGVVRSPFAGRPAVHHGGGIFGFRTHMVRLLDERVNVIVLSNSGWSSPEDVAEGLAELVLAE